jgi:hypothetical protein
LLIQIYAPLLHRHSNFLRAEMYYPLQRGSKIVSVPGKRCDLTRPMVVRSFYTQKCNLSNCPDRFYAEKATLLVTEHKSTAECGMWNSEIADIIISYDISLTRR